MGFDATGFGMGIGGGLFFVQPEFRETRERPREVAARVIAWMSWGAFGVDFMGKRLEIVVEENGFV